MTETSTLGIAPATLYEILAAIVVFLVAIAALLFAVRRFYRNGQNEGYARGHAEGAAESHAKWQRWADKEKPRHDQEIDEARRTTHAKWEQWADRDKARNERLREQARSEGHRQGHRAGVAAAKKAAETESRRKFNAFKAESDTRFAAFKEGAEKRIAEAREEGRKEAIEEARKNSEIAAKLEQAAIRRQVEAQVREDATQELAGVVSEEDIQSEIERRMATLLNGDPFPAPIPS